MECGRAWECEQKNNDRRCWTCSGGSMTASFQRAYSAYSRLTPWQITSWALWFRCIQRHRDNGMSWKSNGSRLKNESIAEEQELGYRERCWTDPTTRARNKGRARLVWSRPHSDVRPRGTSLHHTTISVSSRESKTTTNQRVLSNATYPLQPRDDPGRTSHNRSTSKDGTRVAQSQYRMAE